MKDADLTRPKKLSRRWWTGIVIVSLLILAAAVANFLQLNGNPAWRALRKNALPAEVEEALAAPGSMTLYSLEPEYPHEGAFYGFRILGSTELTGARGARAAEAFHKAVDNWNEAMGMAACFDPRHGLRLVYHEHTYDLVLCYECGQLYVYRDGTALTGLGATGKPSALNQMLVEAQVPLANHTDTPEGQTEAQRRAREHMAAHERWVKAEPASLLPLWSDQAALNDRPDYPAMEAALAQEFPDAEARVMALLGWHGLGERQWLGQPPRYDVDVAQTLLLNCEPVLLVKVAERSDLTEAQLKGAERFFAGAAFSEKYPDGVKSLPPELKQRLLKHALANGDGDTRERARRVFGN